MPYDVSRLRSRVAWSTVSNAADKSSSVSTSPSKKTRRHNSSLYTAQLLFYSFNLNFRLFVQFWLWLCIPIVCYVHSCFLLFFVCVTILAWRVHCVNLAIWLRYVNKLTYKFSSLDVCVYSVCVRFTYLVTSSKVECDLYDVSSDSDVSSDCASDVIAVLIFM